MELDKYTDAINEMMGKIKDKMLSGDDLQLIRQVSLLTDLVSGIQRHAKAIRKLYVRIRRVGKAIEKSSTINMDSYATIQEYADLIAIKIDRSKKSFIAVEARRLSNSKKIAMFRKGRITKYKILVLKEVFDKI